MRYTRPINQEEGFDLEKSLIELKRQFYKNQKLLGNDNVKGSLRYTYEADFMYLLDEIERGPICMRSKRFEQATAIVASMTRSKRVDV